MMLKYLKIWLKVVRKYVTFKYLSITISIFFLCLFFTNLLFGRNMTTSLIILLTVTIIFIFIRLLLFYKRMVNSESYCLLKLKPINPLFGVLVYNKNPLDIFILLPILLYLKIKDFKQ